MHGRRRDDPEGRGEVCHASATALLWPLPCTGGRRAVGRPGQAGRRGRRAGQVPAEVCRQDARAARRGPQEGPEGSAGQRDRPRVGGRHVGLLHRVGLRWRRQPQRLLRHERRDAAAQGVEGGARLRGRPAAQVVQGCDERRLELRAARLQVQPERGGRRRQLVHVIGRRYAAPQLVLLRRRRRRGAVVVLRQATLEQCAAHARRRSTLARTSSPVPHPRRAPPTPCPTHAVPHPRRAHPRHGHPRRGHSLSSHSRVGSEDVGKRAWIIWSVAGCGSRS